MGTHAPCKAQLRGRVASCGRVQHLRRTTLVQEAAGRGEYLLRSVRCAELSDMESTVLMRSGEKRQKYSGG